MKLKLVVIDFELSPRAKRILAAIAVPALVLGGGAVAYANVPKTWSAGETLKAADLNGNFSALEARIGPLENPVNGTWQSYPVDLVDAENPATKITAGVAHNSAFYRRRGDTIEVRAYTEFNGQPLPSGARLGWTLPSGLSIDTSKLPGKQSGYSYRDNLGSGVWSYPGSANAFVFVHSQPSNGVVALGGENYDLGTDTTGIAYGVIELLFSVPVTP